LPGCGKGFFSARAERVCYSFDFGCFDEPYRTKCYAERDRQEQSAEIKSDPQTITHTFRSGDNMLAERGYGSASIGLVYRFIRCMDEIHVAYSLDPKTLKTGDTYYLRVNGRKELVRGAPPATPPTSIPINFDVRWNGIITVKTVRDDIAGQALGMGCFTGQTRELGKVKDLVGPKATIADIKAWMSKLHIGRAETNLPFALTGSREPILSAADQARKNAEVEQAKVNSVNNDALKAARDQSAKIDAQIAVGKKAQADYQTAVENTRRQTDAINAQNAKNRANYEAQQRAYQQRLADHSACVGGNKAACARYNTGE
jgi:hypothetical protein